MDNNRLPPLYGKKVQRLDCCADSAPDDTKTWETAVIHRLLWQFTVQVRHLRRASPCVELEIRARRGLGLGLLSLVKAVICLRRHSQTPRRRPSLSGVEVSVAVSVLTPATLEDASLGVACRKGRQCGPNYPPQTVMTPGSRWISLGVTMLRLTTSLQPLLALLQERSHSTKAGGKACRLDVFVGMARALLTFQKKTSRMFDMR